MEFDGERIDGLRTDRIVRRGIAYVPEDREVFASLTVEENLTLAVRQAEPNRALVDELFPEPSKPSYHHTLRRLYFCVRK